MNTKRAFVIPVTNGNYAPEVHYIGAPDETVAAEAYRGNIKKLRCLLDNLPASGQIEVEVLMVKSNPATAANWINVATYTADGLSAELDVLRWPGVRLRAKSGGTSGTVTVGVVYT